MSNLNVQRAAVIGLGRMGRIHYRALRDLGLDVVTYDPDPSVGADRQIFKAVKGTSPGVVVIACPIDALAEMAAEFAGTPMIVEKPFARTSREARLLGALLRESGVPVVVDYTERMNPVVRKARDYIRSGWGHDRVGLEFCRLSDRPSPSVTLDLLVHDIDLATYLGAGRDVLASFECAASHAFKKRRVRVDSAGARTFDLLAHDASPIHATWHKFLSGAVDDLASTKEAERTLAILEKELDVGDLGDLGERRAGWWLALEA